ncbi:ParA family protein [Nocardioides sp.]|uniref:ParA family protein n=1 Tax=Nocardioides sp. TaxID=35761 RepID=UPI002736F193|nr:ParA family protein [Nocardioides sp.]MDP3893621.1 ParA family protein [Nocardioides sp.]
MTDTPAAGLARTVAVINGKGGVFKSSIVSSVGGLLAEAGWRVLLIDADIQGNLAEDLGLAEVTDEGRHQLDVIPSGLPLHPVTSGRERLDVVCGGELLEDLDAVMSGRQSRDPQWMHGLAKSIDAVQDDYDLVLIDCPPGFPILQTMALVASRYVVIPTRSDSGSRKGMRAVARRFEAARAYNPDLELLGVVRTGITKSAKRIRDEVRREIQDDLGGSAPVFQSVIRYAEGAAKTVRDLGKLPHELEPDIDRLERARLQRLGERKRREKLATKGGKRKADPSEEAEITLTPSLGGVAQDYAELTQEFLDLLTSAEEGVESA